MATRRLVTIVDKRGISSAPNEILKNIVSDCLKLPSTRNGREYTKTDNENSPNNLLSLSELPEDNAADLILNHYWAIS